MAPKNRDELVELINRAVGGKFEYGDAILTAIEQAGCAVVPVEPTEEMLDQTAIDNGSVLMPWRYTDMLSASPYRKE